MVELFTILFPVFALISLGYIGARTGLCPDAGVDGILAFVTNLAAPCLLMRAVLHVSFDAAFNPELLLSFYLPVVFLFFVALGTSRFVWRQRPGESVAIGFAATFGNTVMLGIPVVVGAFGDAAITPLVGIVGLHAVAMYLLGITMMEGLRQKGSGFLAGLRQTLKAVIRNALLIGVALGLAGNLFGLAPLPTAFETATKMLAASAIPLGLFGVGATLVRYQLRADIRIAGTSAVSKLVVQPALTFVLAHWLFGLDKNLIAIATIVAAMPMGMNSYLFAAMYNRAKGTAASGIVLTSLFAALTVPAWLLIVS